MMTGQQQSVKNDDDNESQVSGLEHEKEADTVEHSVEVKKVKRDCNFFIMRFVMGGGSCVSWYYVVIMVGEQGWMGRTIQNL